MPFWSSTSFSFSSSVTHNGQTSAQRYARQTQRSPDGTTVKTASHRTGEPVYTERRDYDAHGRPIAEGNVLGGGQTQRVEDAGRIEDVTDQKQ